LRLAIPPKGGTTNLPRTDIRRRPIIRKIEWVINEAAFGGLLALFDADAERAGEKYELMRSKLIRFFRGRGCRASHELADEVMNRMARRVDQGEEIRTETLVGYFYGVAHNVLRESQRNPETNFSSLETLPPSEHPKENPLRLAESITAKQEAERRLACLESCVENLPPETRRLVISYYEEEKGAKIGNRRRLAEAMGIPINALRVRAHRIRAKLEKCVTGCLGR
jgi:RNA polymerase sigma factor (sigma-70 family)